MKKYPHKIAERARCPGIAPRGFPVTVLLLAATLLAVAGGSLTFAFFTSGASSSGNVFTALSFDDALILSPGKARAVRTADRPEPGESASFLVARGNKEGALELDFGEIGGGGKAFPNTFTIQNVSDRDLHIEIEAHGEIARFVDRIEIGKDNPTKTLSPGETAGASFRLSIPQDVTVGDYSGIIKVKSLNGFLSYDINALVTVRAAPPGGSQSQETTFSEQDLKDGDASAEDPEAQAQLAEPENNGNEPEDNEPPPEETLPSKSEPVQLEIKAPEEGEKIFGTAEVIITATSSLHILEVALTLDGNDLGFKKANQTDTYHFIVDLDEFPEGESVLVITAVDAMGRQATAQRAVFIEPDAK